MGEFYNLSFKVVLIGITDLFNLTRCMATSEMKICIADSQARVRYGLRILLEQQAGWEVVCEATCAIELIQQIRSALPDVAIIDWDLPGMPIEVLIRALNEDRPDLLVISLSGRHELRQSALAAGADAYASKVEPPDNLIQSIQRLLRK